MGEIEKVFVSASESYGKIIISEHQLPSSQKTFRPASMGGIAGGEKYVVQGILFKFSVDHGQLYGGDEAAMKSASHEIRSLMQIQSCRIPGLCFPLLAFIDYRGFRLTAVSLLPLSKHSLIYGSADAGATVYASDPHFNALMVELAGRLNLKGHKVGPSGALTTIHGPCDIEGHRGSDGRYYLLDFSRLAPPSPPTTQGSHLYNLMRMELVRGAPMPLCSDAFSSFGRVGYKKHCAEVRAVWGTLLNEVLPRFACDIDDVSSRSDTLARALSDPKLFVSELHRRGINCRLLGRLRSMVRNCQARSFLLQEMICRTAKSHMGLLLRAKMVETGLPAEEPSLNISIFFLNLLVEKHPLSNDYYQRFLKPALLAKFPGALTDQEIDFASSTRSSSTSEPTSSSSSLSSESSPPPTSSSSTCTSFLIENQISLSSLVFQLCNRIGIQLSTQVRTDLVENPSLVVFVLPDLVHLESRVSHLNIIDYANGMSCIYEALERSSPGKDHSDPALTLTQTRLLNMAQLRLKACSAAISDSHQAIVDLGNVQRLLGRRSGQEAGSAHFEGAEKTFNDVLDQVSHSPIPPDPAILHQIHINLAKLQLSRFKAWQLHNGAQQPDQAQFKRLRAAVLALESVPSSAPARYLFHAGLLRLRLLHRLLFCSLNLHYAHSDCFSTDDVTHDLDLADSTVVQLLQMLLDTKPVGGDGSGRKFYFLYAVTSLLRFLIRTDAASLATLVELCRDRLAQDDTYISKLCRALNPSVPFYRLLLLYLHRQLPRFGDALRQSHSLQEVSLGALDPADQRLSLVTTPTSLEDSLAVFSSSLTSIALDFRLLDNPPALFRLAMACPLLRDLSLSHLPDLASLPVEQPIVSQLQSLSLHSLTESIPLSHVFCPSSSAPSPLLQLTTLSLCHSPIADGALLRFLELAPALTALDLSHSPLFTTLSLKGIALSCPSLRTLSLEGGTLRSFDQLAAALPSFPQLQSLDIKGGFLESGQFLRDPATDAILLPSSYGPSFRLLRTPLGAALHFDHTTASIFQNSFDSRFNSSLGYRLVRKFAHTHQVGYCVHFRQTGANEKYSSNICSIHIERQAGSFSISFSEFPVFSDTFKVTAKIPETSIKSQQQTRIKIFDTTYTVSWSRFPTMMTWTLSVQDEAGNGLHGSIPWPSPAPASILTKTPSRLNYSIFFSIFYGFLAVHLYNA